MSSSHQPSLAGKAAVVTGGASGIGLAAAQAFRDAGARVALLGRNRDALEDARRALGGETLALAADVTSVADLDAAYAQVAERFGPIDVLFANAGVALFAPGAETDEALFDRIADTNFKGAFFTVARAVPHLSDGASVILTSSAVHEIGMPGSSVYSATKAAVRSLARTFAAELAPRRIRVNVVSPGPIETPIFAKTGMSAEQLEGFAAQVGAKVPLGRFGAPSEIAGPVLFLASDAASYVTGADLAADGGFAQV